MRNDTPNDERYQVLARLGSGGMADVYLAIQRGAETFRHLVVLKRIREQFIGDPHALQMFIDEALTVASLSHPHIVAVHDLREIDDCLCIAMDYVDGETLTFILKKLNKVGVRIPLDIAAKIVVETCDALQAAHTATGTDGEPLNLVHRDITPQNLMLDRNGYLKVIDFGIAKSRLQEEKTSPGMVKGKFSYLSPEHFRGKVDARSDIYALGLVFFELLTGQRAVKSSELSLEELMRVVLQRPLPPLGVPNGALPPEIDRLLAKATAKDRADRYQTAEAFASDVEVLMRGRGGVATNARMREWMQTHFAECIANRQEMERRLLRAADEEAANEALNITEAHPCETGESCLVPVGSTPATLFPPPVLITQTSAVIPAPTGGRNNAPLWALLVVVSAFLSYFAFFEEPAGVQVVQAPAVQAPAVQGPALQVVQVPAVQDTATQGTVEDAKSPPVLAVVDAAIEDAAPVVKDAAPPAPVVAARAKVSTPRVRPRIPKAPAPTPPVTVAQPAAPALVPALMPEPALVRASAPEIAPAPVVVAPKPAAPVNQYLSGHGRWSGREVLNAGCKRCHAEMDFVALPAKTAYAAFSRSSHVPQGTLGRLFSATELAKGRRHLRKLKRAARAKAQTTGSNLAGVD